MFFMFSACGTSEPNADIHFIAVCRYFLFSYCSGMSDVLSRVHHVHSLQERMQDLMAQM